MDSREMSAEDIKRVFHHYAFGVLTPDVSFGAHADSTYWRSYVVYPHGTNGLATVKMRGMWC